MTRRAPGGGETARRLAVNSRAEVLGGGGGQGQGQGRGRVGGGRGGGEEVGRDGDAGRQRSVLVDVG